MATDQWEIRLVRPEDNVVLAHVLREVLIEMKVPFDGTALSDPELDAMYDAYQYRKPIIGWCVIAIAFWEVLVLPPCAMVLMGIVSCKKCIFFQRQEEKGWVVK